MQAAPDRSGSARTATGAGLAAALQASRADTLATFAAFERALPGLAVPQRDTLNPPLWELGHIGWFQDHWVSPASRTAAADALYDSSRVAHATRWALPLPDADTTRGHLALQLARTLSRLQEAAQDDATLDPFRLALFHEDMHHEAALYTAQSLGVAIDDGRWQTQALTGERRQLGFDAGPFRLGHPGPGFAFDNELGAHTVELPATHIDHRAVSWREYLPFVETTGHAVPRYLRFEAGAWQQWRHGRWRVLNLDEAACHLSAFDAEAWCRWAGRRLPGEAEWERAAVQQPGAFEWGAVWEWTASPFTAYPGFEPHRYRDYSAPWFGTHRVLRGSSFMTQPRLRHPRYRNFFVPQRSDVPTGFRSCAP